MFSRLLAMLVLYSVLRFIGYLPPPLALHAPADSLTVCSRGISPPAALVLGAVLAAGAAVLLWEAATCELDDTALAQVPPARSKPVHARPRAACA
jgi:hypothetical protein